jgi:hypothetical protein
MPRKNLRIMLCAILSISLTSVSCSEPSGIYIDIKKGAIVSCDGIGLNRITVENDSSEVTLEGTQSIIYFNKKNSVSRTTVYGDIVDNFVLKLKPNCIYHVTKYNGFDRGNLHLTFKTDSSGMIAKASDVDCK